MVTVTLERVVACKPRRRTSAASVMSPTGQRDAARAIRLGLEFGFLVGFILGLSPDGSSGLLGLVR